MQPTLVPEVGQVRPEGTEAAHRKLEVVRLWNGEERHARQRSGGDPIDESVTAIAD
jgi:hypothetical protein